MLSRFFSMLLTRDNERRQRRALENYDPSKVVSLKAVHEAVMASLTPEARKSYGEFQVPVFAQIQQPVLEGAIPAYTRSGATPYFLKNGASFEDLLHGADDICIRPIDVARIARSNGLQRSSRDLGLKMYGDIYRPLLRAMHAAEDHSKLVEEGVLKCFNGADQSKLRDMAVKLKYLELPAYFKPSYRRQFSYTPG